MARSLGALTIDLIAKVGGFTAGLTQAEREAKRRAAGIKSAFGSLKGILAGIGLAVGIREIVEATAEAEKQLALLDNAVRASGGAAGFTTQELAKMSGELQKVTTYGDETIQGMQQLLLRFQSIKGDNFVRAQENVLDLAAALNIDLKAAAQLVGKALEDPEKGMSQLAERGVVLSDAQKNLVKSMVAVGDQAGAQAVLLTELERVYKGAAPAARDTLGGALQALSNAFGDLKEGDKGVEGATEAINKFTETLQDEKTIKAANALISVIFKIGEGWALLAGLAGDLFTGSSISPELNRLYEEHERLSKGIGDTFDRLQEMERAGLENSRSYAKLTNQLSLYKSQVIGVREEIAKLNEQNREQSGTQAGGPTAVPIAAPPSEEFTKLADRLNEQIALYGKVGEAAKVAYQIQSGQLDALSEAEQQQILLLAQQFDGLEANKLAMDEMAKAQEEYYAMQADLLADYADNLQAMEDFAIEAGHDISEIALDQSLQFVEAELAAFEDAVGKKLDLEEDLQEQLDRLRAEGYDNAVNGLDFILGKHKSVAAAVFLLNKRHAIAQAIVSGKAAVVETFKNAGGWPWGVVPAGVMAALNAANIAAMVSAAPGMSSSGGSYTGGGGGRYLPNPGGGLDRSAGDVQRGVTARPAINVTINGFISQSVIDDLVEQLRDFTDNRDGVIFSVNSRQAQEIRA